ncbi:hypothetical protein ACWDTD_14370 [Gordonia sp. NPDC003425]
MSKVGDDRPSPGFRACLKAQAVVIGHANHPAVMHLYPQLAEIIRQRNLTMVTLDDYSQT